MPFPFLSINCVCKVVLGSQWKGQDLQPTRGHGDPTASQQTGRLPFLPSAHIIDTVLSDLVFSLSDFPEAFISALRQPGPQTVEFPFQECGGFIHHMTWASDISCGPHVPHL